MLVIVIIIIIKITMREIVEIGSKRWIGIWMYIGMRICTGIRIRIEIGIGMWMGREEWGKGARGARGPTVANHTYLQMRIQLT